MTVSKQKEISFYHSGNLGDIIFSLPAVKALGGGNYYVSSAPNPKLPEISRPRLMAKESVQQMVDFLKTQPYLKNVAVYNNESIDIDLDKWKLHAANGKHLILNYLELLSVKTDLSRPWLENISPKYVNDIVIQYTGRWIKPVSRINWECLKRFEKKCVFIGYSEEHQNFLNSTGLSMERFPAKDILEIAQVIKGSRLFIGNQSLGFALAEGLKHPRIHEMNFSNPVNLPQSSNGFIFLNASLVEKLLQNRKPWLRGVWEQRVGLAYYNIVSLFQKYKQIGVKAFMVKIVNRLRGKS